MSISYVSDWGTQGLGVFLDDARVIADGVDGRRDLLRDRGPGRLDGRRAAGRFVPRRTNWSRSQQAFEEGAVVVTADTVYLGFGLEGLAPAARDDFVARSLPHLLGGRGQH